MRCPTVNDLPSPPSGKEGWPWTEDSPPHFRPASESDRAVPVLKDLPRITVVTPSYNQRQYLEETIRSVLLQGYPNLEYIIVDDRSTDDSVEIIRRYEPFLSWWGINDRNRGQSYTINRGFRHSSGHIHAYLNSDDYYEPGALQRCASLFQQGHQWIVGQVRFFQEGAGYGPVSQRPNQPIADWLVSCPISQPGCFWSATLHHQVGPFREDLHYFMDYEFWLRLRIVEQITPFGTDTPIAVYRLHPHSKTVAHMSGFEREAGPIRAHYQRYLSPSQQLWLKLARRHRKARYHGATAVSFLKQGNRQDAAKELFQALLVWPFCIFDLRNYHLAFKAARTPFVGPRWFE